ncbi:MAG: polysaccharide deacetylase family protein [Frankiaceae bacterium]
MRRTLSATVAGALAVTLLPAVTAPAAPTLSAPALSAPARFAPALAASALHQRWPLLGVGSVGLDVRTAKHLLRASGYGVVTDAAYRSATASAVRRFQGDRGMTLTGMIGSPTWRALFVTLRPGSTGEAVSGLQYQLLKDGFGGRVTGSYDAGTVARVKAAQSVLGLTADGVAGPATWSALVSHYRPAVLVSKGTTTKKLVALTFDAGADLGHAWQILDLLRAEGIKATFGVTGAWVDAHPLAARRIVAEGHEIMNHTYDHASFTGFSTGKAALAFSQRRTEVMRAWATIDATTGASFTRWWRPPYGDRDASVDRDVSSLGYGRELMWTVDSLGWEGIAPSEVVSRCVGAATPGEIILMHVGAASTDSAALPEVISRLRALGYGFATASGVMA